MLVPSRKCNYRCNSSALASKMICSEVLVILVQGKGTFVTYLGIHSSATLPRNEAASFDEIYSLALNLLILCALYFTLGSSDKSRGIYKEFLGHKWNNRINRTSCWFIWIISAVLPTTLAIYFKGFTTLRLF